MNVISKIKQLQEALKAEQGKENPDLDVINGIKSQIIQLGLYLTPEDIYNNGL